MQGHSHLAEGCHRALAAALLLALSGCAATGTIAFGEHARAAIAQPQSLCPPTNLGITGGTKTTKVTEYDDKIGLKPQIESVTETTEPAPPPVQAPLHESQGAKVSETGGGLIRTLLGPVWTGFKWFLGIP